MPFSENPYICDKCGRVTIYSGEVYADCPICGDQAEFDISLDENHNETE